MTVLRAFSAALFVGILSVAGVVYATAGTNAECGQAERDAHSITGPDGATYLTYAGQRDDVRPNGATGTFCFFGVEHGTQPRMVGIPPAAWPAYNYATSKAGAPAENQEGFKSAGFLLDGKRVLYTLHRESGTGLGHACLQHHEAHIAVADDATGELLYRRSWLANFGPARYNGDDNLIFRPAACVQQFELARASSSDLVSRRSEPVQNAPDGKPLVLYNPWQFGPEYNPTGLGGYVVQNRRDATNVCRYAGPEDWCASAFSTGRKGLGAGLLLWNARLYANGAASGDFCTNPKGLAVQDCGLTNSVRQWIKPGLDWNHVGSAVECADVYSENGRLYLCSPNARNTIQDMQDVSGKIQASKN
jgi:hypothetical protein